MFSLNAREAVVRASGYGAAGRSFGDYLRSEVLLPLGMSDCWVGGMPPAAFAEYRAAGRLAPL